MIEFSQARREKVKLRAALIGPPGSGKSLGALNIARALGEPIFAIDSEHERLKLYADRFDFQHGSLPPSMQTPEGYVEAVRAALAAGAGTVIIDSFSHEWLAVLEEADRFADWKNLTPRHRACVELLVSLPAHVIVTMRAKVKYDVSEVEEGGRKKQKIERIGIGPVQRENVEYEFDVIGYLDAEHRATFLNRCDALVGQTLTIPEAVPPLLEWLESGDPDPNMMRAPQEKVDELRAILLGEGQSEAVVDDAFHRTAFKSGGVLTLGWVQEKIDAAVARSKGGPVVVEAGHDLPVPKTWTEVAATVTAAYGAGAWDDFGAFVNDASVLTNGKPVDVLEGGKIESKLTRPELAVLLQKAAGAAVALRDAVQRELPPPSRAEYQAAWASVLDEGVMLDGPGWSLGPDEADRPARAAAAEEAS